MAIDPDDLRDQPFLDEFDADSTSSLVGRLKRAFAAHQHLDLDAAKALCLRLEKESLKRHGHAKTEQLNQQAVQHLAAALLEQLDLRLGWATPDHPLCERLASLGGLGATLLDALADQAQDFYAVAPQLLSRLAQATAPLPTSVSQTLLDRLYFEFGRLGPTPDQNQQAQLLAIAQALSPRADPAQQPYFMPLQIDLLLPTVNDLLQSHAGAWQRLEQALELSRSLAPSPVVDYLRHVLEVAAPALRAPTPSPRWEKLVERLSALAATHGLDLSGELSACNQRPLPPPTTLLATALDATPDQLAKHLADWLPHANDLPQVADLLQLRITRCARDWGTAPNVPRSPQHWSALLAMEQQWAQASGDAALARRHHRRTELTLEDLHHPALPMFDAAPTASSPLALYPRALRLLDQPQHGPENDALLVALARRLLQELDLALGTWLQADEEPDSATQQQLVELNRMLHRLQDIADRREADTPISGLQALWERDLYLRLWSTTSEERPPHSTDATTRREFDLERANDRLQRWIDLYQRADITAALRYLAAIRQREADYREEFAQRFGY